MPSPPQQVYSERYEPLRLVARGGMAEVWLARDGLLDRMVALKILFPELSIDRNFVERFRREAQAAANLSHPNIVSVYDWGEAEGTYFIVMEYVDGKPLSALLREEGPLLADRAASIGADVASALGFAHRNGVIHRDVKPGNVLITVDDQVKVTDFGIARAVGVDDHLTQTGAVMGTATYFSPEQAQGLPVDQRSDVYSLGVVLYEMVTGEPPFVADSPVAVAYKHVHEQPDPPRWLNPELQAPFEAIVLQALAKDVHRRYASAEEVRADLLRFRQGRQVLAEAPPPPPPRAGRHYAGGREDAGRGRGVGGAAAAAGAGAAGAGAAGAGLAGPGGGPPPTTIVAASGTAGTTGPARDATAAHHVTASEPKTGIRTLLIVLVVLLAALGIVVWLLSRQLDIFGTVSSASPPTTAVRPVAIPSDVVGKTYTDAVTELQGIGVATINRSEVNDPSHPADTVTAVNPPAGQDVAPGGTVTLTVASGPPVLTEPDVVGLTLQTASAQLTAAGFKVGPSQTQDSTTVQAGLVVGQNPPAGNQGNAGDTVILTLSDGRGQALVPNEAGKDKATAENDLTQAGLKFVIGYPTGSATVPAGDIVKTQPAAGTPLPKGSTVTLIPSSGPAKVNVPYLKGYTLSSAQQILTDRGLVVAVTYTQVSYGSQNNIVIDQTPAGGSVAEQGSTVDLEVGQYGSTPTSSGT